jgi:hypothetical protein
VFRQQSLLAYRWAVSFGAPPNSTGPPNGAGHALSRKSLRWTIVGSLAGILSVLATVFPLISANEGSSNGKGQGGSDVSAEVTRSSTAAPAVPGGQEKTPSLPPPTSVVRPKQGLVLVRFGAELSGPVYAADTNLVLDGVPQERLSIDQGRREGVVGVRLAPGTHRYDLSVSWIDTSGIQHLNEGSGSVEAVDGRVYGVRLDDAGSAWLTVP